MAGRLGSAGAVSWSVYAWPVQDDRLRVMTGSAQVSILRVLTEWKLHSLFGLSLRRRAVTSSTFCWSQESPRPSPRGGQLDSTSWWAVARSHCWGACRVEAIVVAIFDQYYLPWRHRWDPLCHSGDEGRYPWEGIPRFKLKITVSCICHKPLNVYIFFSLGESRRATLESLYQTSEHLEELGKINQVKSFY